jgi:hypothetical protein|nr:MAG TPA: head to tail connecting protein [Caudoviricetes sp.]
MDSRADEIIQRHQRFKSERSIWESHWQELAERIWPDRAQFTERKLTEGGKRNERMFDATAALALTRFAAAMESMLTPRTAKWHKLRVPDEDLNQSPAVQRYLDEVTNILFRVRYSANANFASQMHEAYMSLGSFGTGGVLVEDMLGVGIRYKSIDLANLYFAENRHGIIDTAHRWFEYTARQAMQHFDPDRLPSKIRDFAEKNPEQKFEFIHCVRPNDERKRGDTGYRGMQYASYYVCLDSKSIVEEGGYRTMPYALGRYITTPGETYGRGPAMLVLPDIKMLNEMKKTIIRSAHLAVSPPLLLQEDGALSAFDLRPNALNFGGMDERGTPLVAPLKIDAKLDLGMEMLEQQQRVINDAFLVTLFQILVDQPNMTATEAMLRAQEKGALLAPTMGRQQSELLGPLIERELDILARAGMLPEMPEELAELGGDVDIEYVSPLNRAQRAEDGVAILRTFEAVAPLAQVDPSVMMAFDLAQAARELAQINGVPAKIIRSDDDIAAMQEEKQMQVDAAQILEAAPIAADTARTLVETQQIASQGAPAVMPA